MSFSTTKSAYLYFSAHLFYHLAFYPLMLHTDHTVHHTPFTLYLELREQAQRKKRLVEELTLKSEFFRQHLPRDPLKLKIASCNQLLFEPLRTLQSVFCYPCDKSSFRFGPLFLFSSCLH